MNPRKLFSRLGIFNTLVILGTVFSLSALLVAYNFYIQRRAVVDYTRGALEFLVLGGALSIRGEDVLELNREVDWRKPAYARVYRVLADLYRPNVDKQLRENSIYILRPDATGEKTFFAAHLPGVMDAPLHLGRIEDMSDPRVNYIGDSYQLTPLMREVLDGRRPFASTGIYEDDHGVWVSAYAPIRDAAGRVVALLEADYPIGVIHSQILNQFYAELIAILIAALATAGVVVWLSRRITGPLGRLVEAFDQIIAGEPGVRVDFGRVDEIGRLGTHFNRMARVIEEKSQLVRYVSSETVRKIETSDARGVQQGQRNERVELCMLFSDIRGFTAFSDGQPVETVVEVLNDILQMQTECIARQGGVVDKFVGDEIMAEFKGEDKVDRALAAALHIQASMQNGGGREGLEVGIGVNVGEVIRGDIGTYFRLDYTVIGSTVNLAARLCSVAKGGQILVPEATLQRAQERYAVALLGRAKAKGISEPFRLYSVQGAA